MFFSHILAPRNSGEIESVSQNETSITLQWGKVDEILDYTLQLNGSVIEVRASEGQKRVTHAILGLMSGTKYNFSLFAVFASIPSSGVNYTAATGKMCFLLIHVYKTNQDRV